MKLIDRLLRLSATDLANHLGCSHLSRLNRAVAAGELRRPRWHDPVGELLQERGREHEKAYLEHLRETVGIDVVEIRADEMEDGVAKTIAAMRAGARLIYQAPLGNERWYGRADFLERVETPSALGAWSYEVTDAKLATETRAGTILQLCVYSELLANIQREWPKRAAVVAPHHGFEPERYRLADFAAYYRLVKTRLETALGERDAGNLPASIDPVQQCEICAWWQRCDAERRAADHLSFVAGISRLQIKELRRFNVDTLERLGELRDVPKPSRGSRDALIRTRDQAAIQLAGRRANAPLHEVLLPLGPEHGFALLPEPSAHDMFLDLEGDRLAADGGREYLFGYLEAPDDARAARRYVPIWAADPAGEKRAFERVVDTIVQTFAKHPEVHVYHFGAYEPAAFKRLSGRYATREAELDTILRAELFVDLYTIVRHGLKASVESYSIKDLEQFYGFPRQQDLRAATASRRAIEWAIELHEPLPIGTAAAAAPRSGATAQMELALAPSPAAADAADTRATARLAAHVAAVESYNREDCVSAEKLRDWLETLRADALRQGGVDLPRPELKTGEASDAIEETAEETQRVMEQLLKDVPIDAAERRQSPELEARWLMAHLLEWHRREEKAAWWEFFRLRDLPLEDYEDERSALAGLAFVATVGGTAKRPIHRYSFPPQDFDIRRRDKACVPPEGTTIGDVVAVDVGAHTIDIQHGGPHADLRPVRLFVHRKVPPGPQPQALLEIGRWIAAHGVDAAGEHRAARDLLLRNTPRFAAGSRGLVATDDPPAAAAPADPKIVSLGAARSARELRKATTGGSDDPEVVLAQRLAFELDRGVLPIQGPPGTGKTFTGSHMILGLLKAGKKVGVTAVSHEAIRNLLKDVCARAAEHGMADFECLHKGGTAKDEDPKGLLLTDDNGEAARYFTASGRALLGGTAWLWSRPEFRRSADVLFIDEAGQMSLADVLAVSAGTSSLVLLGDPQQLEQPQQATHPPGAQASALEHILGGARTIPRDRGMFLHQTRRLHPAICAFTAEAFYDGRLSSFPTLDRQAVLSRVGSKAAAIGAAGLVYVPVPHEGRQSRADEEVDAIVKLVENLTSGASTWRDKDGREAPLTRADLMVVAPYNAQVTALTAKLAGVKVGTVDKFQGQQAPVVIVSLTTSTAEDAPRGMDFLYSANRLNVATSRAKALCILVGNPKLFEPDCRTPKQMQLANAFCRYAELARVVAP
jgi:predicted RecB family nuclease